MAEYTSIKVNVSTAERLRSLQSLILRRGVASTRLGLREEHRGLPIGAVVDLALQALEERMKK